MSNYDRAIGNFPTITFRSDTSGTEYVFFLKDDILTGSIVAWCDTVAGGIATSAQDEEILDYIADAVKTYEEM